MYTIQAFPQMYTGKSFCYVEILLIYKLHARNIILWTSMPATMSTHAFATNLHVDNKQAIGNTGMDYRVLQVDMWNSVFWYKQGYCGRRWYYELW